MPGFAAANELLRSMLMQAADVLRAMAAELVFCADNLSYLEFE